MKLPGLDKWMVGYDIGEDAVQISYCTSPDDVTTLSSVMGAQVYNIPLALCKRPGVNQWFYGAEALRFEKEEGGILVRDLFALALDGEPVMVDGTSLDPVALFSLFLKRSLGLLTQVFPVERMAALMFTAPVLDQKAIAVLERATAALRLRTQEITYQSHAESFYHFLLHEPNELWQSGAMLYEYWGGEIHSMCMECNPHTTPTVVYMREEAHAFGAYDVLPEGEKLRLERMERMDEGFLSIIEETMGDEMPGSIYLVGEQFSKEWMRESLRLLCRGRRVFQGNNLYSKGACYGLCERMGKDAAERTHVFLGKDKLKANIGMKVYDRGRESYLALLDAGNNWYESGGSVELYLQGGAVLEFLITSLVGGGSHIERMDLTGLSDGIVRIRVKVWMASEEQMAVNVTDLGFGSFQDASGRTWEAMISLEKGAVV